MQLLTTIKFKLCPNLIKWKKIAQQDDAPERFAPGDPRRWADPNDLNFITADSPIKRYNLIQRKYYESINSKVS